MFVWRLIFGLIRLEEAVIAPLAQLVAQAPLIALWAIMVTITLIINNFYIAIQAMGYVKGIRCYH